jgi:hypothetical protein
MTEDELKAPAGQAPVTHGAAGRSRLVYWRQYQADNSHMFESPPSWQWYMRQNREELASRKAIVLVAGRLHVEPEAFQAAVIDIGSRLLRK